MITLQQVENEISRNVQQWMNTRGASKKFIYTNANMSRDMFDRRLNAGGWTLPEVVRVARALGVSTGELVPATFLTITDAA